MVCCTPLYLILAFRLLTLFAIFELDLSYLFGCSGNLVLSTVLLIAWALVEGLVGIVSMAPEATPFLDMLTICWKCLLGGFWSGWFIPFWMDIHMVYLILLFWHFCLVWREVKPYSKLVSQCCACNKEIFVVLDTFCIIYPLENLPLLYCRSIQAPNELQAIIIWTIAFYRRPQHNLNK